MANLLPLKELDALNAERRRWLRIAALVLVCGACAFGTVLLVPSAVVLIAARSSGEKHLATTRELIALQKHAGAGADIAATKEKMGLLASNNASIVPHELLSRTIPLLPPGVTLSNIVFTREEEKAILDLSGSAESRASLIAFGDALESSGLFIDVNIPIESLAQNTDLQFRLILTLAETLL
jgi:hypothetical protein